MHACLVHTHPGVFLVLRPSRAQVQGRIKHVYSTCMRVYTYTILLLLILKSRALTTSTRRIERDVKKIRDYATVFRDSRIEVKFPGLSRKIREGWQVYGADKYGSNNISMWGALNTAAAGAVRVARAG